MANLQIEDRVLETSTTTGTVSYLLAGAVPGFFAFGAVVANGDAVQYYAEAVDADGVPTGDVEVGRGVWTTGGNLSRLRIFASSNAGAVVNWAAGPKRVGLTVPASSFVVNSLGNQLARWSLNHMG